MDLAIARRIKDAADALFLEATVYEDYSGRSMYGATTAAIVVPHPLSLAAAVGQAVLIASGDRSGIAPGRIIDEVANLRSDDFGHDTIVY